MMIKFDEGTTKKIVEGYYRKYEDFDCSLEMIRNVREHPRMTRTDLRYVELSFVLRGKLDISGEEVFVSAPIEHEDVRNAFKTTLENDGYAVENVSIEYDDALESMSNNCFRCVVVDMSTKRMIK